MLEFEWDEAKRRLNLAKHRIDFSRGARVLDSNPLQYEVTRSEDRERRYCAIGEVDGQILRVVYTWRGNTCRLISARRARRDERATYYASFRG